MEESESWSPPNVDPWRRVASGRPDQARIESELAQIASDLGVRVLPDLGDAVGVEFFCNLKTAEDFEREWREQEEDRRSFPDDHQDPEGWWIEDVGRTWTVYLQASDGSGTCFVVYSGDEQAADRIEWMADQFQDVVIDSTWVARPRCPGHPHPLVPRIKDATVWWTCPKSSATRCEVGTYRAFAEQAGLTILDD